MTVWQLSPTRLLHVCQAYTRAVKAQHTSDMLWCHWRRNNRDKLDKLKVFRGKEICLVLCGARAADKALVSQWMEEGFTVLLASDSGYAPVVACAR